VAWSGSLTTGPGLSTFYLASTDLTGKPANLVTFFTAIRSFFPTGMTWTIPTSGDQLDDATGALVGAWSASGGGVVTGNASGTNYAQGVGCRITWNTNGIHRGRRVRGTTFLTSLNAIEFQVDGTPQGGTVTAIQSAANTLVTNLGSMVIWGRPKGSESGASFNVQNATVPDAVSWLRSRRT